MKDKQDKKGKKDKKENKNGEILTRTSSTSPEKTTTSAAFC